MRNLVSGLTLASPGSSDDPFHLCQRAVSVIGTVFTVNDKTVGDTGDIIGRLEYVIQI